MIEPTQAERLAFVKYARHTALVADRWCAALYKLSQQLEEDKIIDKDRKSKEERDKKLKLQEKQVHASDDEVKKLLAQLENNPDAELIVASVFRDLDPSKLKRMYSRKEKKTSEEKEEE